MEHRWGRNVFDLGMGGLCDGLCARALAYPGWVLTNRRRPSGAQDWWSVPFPGSGIEEYTPFADQGVASGPFPYGQLVEPDVPL